MGLRLRRRVGLLRGVRLNVSRGGLSVSIGRPGAWMTFGPAGRRRATLGWPGSGLSYTVQSRGGRQPGGSAAQAVPDAGGAPSGAGLIALGAVLLAVIALCAFALFSL